MSKNLQNYFTTGELSQLCKIPRKTLLYYDKLGLITPELVDENGYRYYKRSQLFLLQRFLRYASLRYRLHASRIILPTARRKTIVIYLMSA